MNLPKDFCIRMEEMLGGEYARFIESFENENVYTGLRLNPKKENEIFKDMLADCEKVEWCADGYYCKKDKISGNHPYHLGGLCYFQEPSAMSVIEALKICPDDYILDLCAAPGGKATQAGAKLSDKGLLVANEIIPKRAQILADNIERFGISNAVVTNETPERLSAHYPEFFDKIVVDAPCSGEGMFKKEPQAIGEWSVNHTLSCAVRQKHIMDSAYLMLRPGGAMVYSTCTFAPCENEGVVDYMLSKYEDLELAYTGLYMLSEGKGEFIGTDRDLSLCRRIFPHIHRGEGHFIAVLKKSGTRNERIIPVLKEDKNIKEAIMQFKRFEKETLNTDIDGCFKLFADNLYLVPHSLNIDRLKIVKAGFYLGICKKNRFEPSHALALALKKEDFKNFISFAHNDKSLLKYLHGEAISGDFKGFTAVAAEDNPLGWAKGSEGVLKNHYPKYLRIF